MTVMLGHNTEFLHLQGAGARWPRISGRPRKGGALKKKEGAGAADKITIKVDNNQAKVFANDETISSRLRTAFSLKEAWVQEIKDAGEVSVVQIPADINVSDMLTKVQPGTKVKRYIDLINPIKINRRQQVEDPEGM